jgi:hypothetical protein
LNNCRTQFWVSVQWNTIWTHSLYQIKKAKGTGPLAL